LLLLGGALAAIGTAASSLTSNQIVAFLLALVVGMFGFGFALVPMYDLLCTVTGLCGRTGDLYVYDPAVVKPDETRL
jgi:cytochrome c oxidase assembly protein subunit 11